VIRRLARLAPLCAALALVACSSDKLLGPDAEQGVDGLVMRGPLCPVSSPDDPCPDQPYQATIDILDESQHSVTRVQSGADGKFRVGLEPGLYILVPEQGDPFPSAKESVVEVRAGVWASVTIQYDHGIR